MGIRVLTCYGFSIQGPKPVLGNLYLYEVETGIVF